MKLSELLNGVDSQIRCVMHCESKGGELNVEINRLTFDSRTVDAGSMFFAIRGEHVDGHNFIYDVINKGASAVVCNSEFTIDNPKFDEILKASPRCVLCVVNDEMSEIMAIISKNFYGDPSSKLNLVGVTGTNGKTTIATLLYRLFLGLGYKVGLISTIENRINDKVIPATHTTPDTIKLNSLLNDMVVMGCEYCFMEVSSHAVVQNRIVGLTFKGGVFTNLTHDHLDYHKTFAEYLKAKKIFFDRLDRDAFALTNGDDRNGDVMLQNTKACKKSYALKSMADFMCARLENSFDGMLLNFDGIEVWTRLVGEFNAYNLLAIYATAMLLQQDKEEVLRVMSTLAPAEGRFDLIKLDGGKNVIVDYAHTPDALVNVLDTINEINEGRGKVITVVGAGGDRDKSKRPEMAQAAIDRSDLLILTSDNPRTENPAQILEDMQSGLRIKDKKMLVIENRREAIRTAVMFAVAGDIVLIAGKGHEKYQEVNGVRVHFDDKEEVKSQL